MRRTLFYLFGYTPWRNPDDDGHVPEDEDGEMLDAWTLPWTRLARFVTHWHC